MPEPVASPAAPAAPTTLATGEAPPVVAPAAAPAAPAVPDAAAVEAAAKAEAERVAKLTPEQKKEETDAKAKTEADAKAEADRVAKLTPEQKKVEADAKAKADADAKAKLVPDKYELKLPDGLTLDAEVSGEFEKTAKELGLSQDAAQRLYDLGAKATQRNTAALLTNVKALQDSWLASSTADKEFGGENLAKNMAVAKTALRFGSPELVKVLNESRLGDHPEVIRWMYRVGKAMAEDTFTPGGQPISRDASEAAMAKRLYPNQN